MSTFSKQPSVLVLGGGVSGLTTALELRRSGFEVTVLAKEFVNIVSEVAGALWEWPPAVCGDEQSLEDLLRRKKWCWKSYQVFKEMAKDGSDNGVHMKMSAFFFAEKLGGKAWKKKNEMVHLQGFRHDVDIISESGINPEGFHDAYELLVPVVDTVKYLQWLKEVCFKLGVQFVSREVTGLLRDNVDRLRAEFEAEFIVNCTGLQARVLCSDVNMKPVRGMIVHCKNDGALFPKLEKALICAVGHIPQQYSSAKHEFLFVLPRGEDDLWIGGIAEPNEWMTSGFDLQNPRPKSIFQNAQKFYPPLENIKESDVCEVLVGIRPYRMGGVRLEWDQESQGVFHNYGHGGSGFTLSWGCSKQVAEEILDEVARRSMQEMNLQRKTRC